MGERVTCIEMQAFRGVREKLTLEFPRGASAVLLGENATGKSTVADALEWYFTGEIGLLRHEGRAASLRHVDARSCDATSVTLQTTGALARVSEICGEGRLFSLVSLGSGGGFRVLPTSASGGIAVEVEKCGEFVLERADLGEHAVGPGRPRSPW